MRLVLTLAFTLCISAGYAQGFIEQYRHFWLHRLAKNSGPISATLSKGTVSARPINRAESEARRAKIDQLQHVIKAHPDFDQSDSVFVLLFSNEKTLLERTYVWNSKVNFYFEDFVTTDSTGIEQKRVKRTDASRPPQFVTHTLITKEDTLRSLLMRNQLSTMNRLAYTFRVDTGETCLALFSKKISVNQYRLSYVDLPPFNYISLRSK